MVQIAGSMCFTSRKTLAKLQQKQHTHDTHQCYCLKQGCLQVGRRRNLRPNWPRGRIPQNSPYVLMTSASWHIFCAQNELRPEPRRGSLQRSPYPLAGWKGAATPQKSYPLSLGLRPRISAVRTTSCSFLGLTPLVWS